MTILEINMKKYLSVVFIIFFAFTSLYSEENLFSFSVGLASGFPIYGSDSADFTGSEIEKGNRVILGTVASVNFNILKQVSFFLGNDILWDLTWNSSEKSNMTHISFPLGIKVYPGLGGMNFGLAYTLGVRADNIKTDKIKEYSDTTSWGNGFKFLAEYNFAHEGGSRFLPTIGGYWNLMPRGHDSFDNLIVFYVAANF